MYFALASNYAESLFAENPGYQDALDTLAIASETPSCKDLLYSPESEAQDIQAFLESLLPKSLDLSKFIQLLIEKKRLTFLPQIAEAYYHTTLKAQGITPVQVRSAKKLQAKDKKQVLSILHEILGKESKPQIDYQVDASVIACLQIQYQHNVIDLSLKGQLENLKNQILGVEYD